MAKILQEPRKIDVVKPVVIPKCDECRWYVKSDKAPGVGECRRYPPSPEGRFAFTAAVSFCGEFATK